MQEHAPQTCRSTHRKHAGARRANMQEHAPQTCRSTHSTSFAHLWASDNESCFEVQTILFTYVERRRTVKNAKMLKFDSSFASCGCHSLNDAKTICIHFITSSRIGGILPTPYPLTSGCHPICLGPLTLQSKNRPLGVHNVVL